MPFKTASARQTGTAHDLEGRPCQDSVCCVAAEDAACAALADGAGSRADSQLASAAVTAAVAEELSGNFSAWYGLEDEEFIRRMLALCRDAVESAAPGTEAACTLLAAAASVDGRSLACHIGDGAVIGAGPGVRTLLSPPENGSELWYTYFVSGHTAERHLRVYRDLPAGCRTLILCSDGAGEALLSGSEPARAAEIIDAWMSSIDGEEVSRRLDQALDEVFRDCTDDDMSLAVLYRAPGED